MSGSADAALAAEGLAVAAGGRRVVEGLTLTVAPGELVAVIGANGAGKSTLLRALAGLARPAAGRVTIAGRPLDAWSRMELGRAVAYLPQDRLAHWPLAVKEVVALGRLPHGAGAGTLAPRDAAAVAAAIAALDLAHIADRPVTELSGGERARALVARAFAQEARFLVADEPTAALDPAHQLALFERFVELTRSGRSVIVALHDLSLAARFATRIVLLAAGRALAAGPPAEVLTPANLAAGYGIHARVASVDGVPVVVPVARAV